MNRKYVAALLPVVLAACASQSSRPEVKVPDSLKPSADEVSLGSVAGRGVQIYECRVKKDNPQAAEWAFVAPEAELWDAQGKRVGKHYAGPHWENVDGSKVSGTVKARADAPVAGAIPQLLLTTRSQGPDGAYAKVTSIQRLNTVGGVAPADGCTMASLGKSARVAYEADYVLFVSK